MGRLVRRTPAEALTVPLISISYNFEELYADLLDLARDQVPFALSQTINQAAKDFQGAERQVITDNFTLRHKQFIINGVYIGRFSNKRDSPMYVEVQIEPHRDFMYKFEAGDTKTPRGAHLAIPVDARPSQMSLVPADLRPKALGLSAHTTKHGQIQYKGEKRTFLIRLSDGSPAIMQRTGPGPRDVRLLYTLKLSAPTPASLHFAETARGTVVDSIQRNFALFFAEARRTAR